MTGAGSVLVASVFTTASVFPATRETSVDLPEPLRPSDSPQAGALQPHYVVRLHRPPQCQFAPNQRAMDLS